MDVTPKMIEALRTLREVARTYMAEIKVVDALNVLDDAGVFKAIDEATDYDVSPAPQRVSKCTCAPYKLIGNMHMNGCPGDPAEWGDMAYTTPDQVRAAGAFIRSTTGLKF